MAQQGKWVNKRRIVTGYWNYVWSADMFVIVLNSTDRLTGMQRVLHVHGDTPEWGNWKLVRQ